MQHIKTVTTSSCTIKGQYYWNLMLFSTSRTEERDQRQQLHCIAVLQQPRGPQFVAAIVSHAYCFSSKGRHSSPHCESSCCFLHPSPCPTLPQVLSACLDFLSAPWPRITQLNHVEDLCSAVDLVMCHMKLCKEYKMVCQYLQICLCTMTKSGWQHLIFVSSLLFWHWFPNCCLSPQQCQGNSAHQVPMLYRFKNVYAVLMHCRQSLHFLSHPHLSGLGGGHMCNARASGQPGTHMFLYCKMLLLQ